MRRVRYTALHAAEIDGGGLEFKPKGSKLSQLSSRVVDLTSELFSKSLCLRITFLLLGLGALFWLLYESVSTFSGIHLVWLILIGTYGYITERCRLGSCRVENKKLQEKCKKLVQARRAAGLLRLDKDTSLRREHWPAPPHSGAKAFLFKEDLIDAPQSPHKIDYRDLCISMTSELLAHNRRASIGDVSKSWHTLFRLLSQAGPEPVKDAELYKDMHIALDEVERQLQSASQGFYCRLCLGYQRSNDPVKLKCSHCICKNCATSLVSSAIAGSIGVPISCPVGCSSLMSPQIARKFLGEEDFDRFQRIHNVKMSLTISAPHSRSLASELAEARRGLLAKDPGSNEVKMASEGATSAPVLGFPGNNLSHRNRGH
mmetsp:Transcript_12552/g.31855  ORF Transcript_12552/g.31855 Transcript_12552/m.31855 type:complete len:373 (+) Transcript_12552:135-1253(+)